MTLNIDWLVEEKAVVFKVGERLDYVCTSEIHHAYQTIEKNNYEIVIDLEDTDYIDSYGLKVFSTLLEHRHDDTDMIIRIVNCKPCIKEHLSRLSLQNFFQIH